MLLRRADPELRTDAARACALRSPFSSPFIDGGLVAALLPMLAARGVWVLTLGALGGAVAIVVLARVLGFWRRPLPGQRLVGG